MILRECPCLFDRDESRCAILAVADAVSKWWAELSPRQHRVSPRYLSSPRRNIPWPIPGTLPASVRYAGARDDIPERERKGLEGKIQ